MPDDATKGVAEHNSRLQPSINLHAPVAAFMFSYSGTSGVTSNFGPPTGSKKLAPNPHLALYGLKMGPFGPLFAFSHDRHGPLPSPSSCAQSARLLQWSCRRYVSVPDRSASICPSRRGTPGPQPTQVGQRFGRHARQTTLAPLPERVEFKLCSIVYKCLHDSAPWYLSQYCIPVASLPGRSHLRSAASGDLFVSATSTKTIGPRGFFHAGPTAWNCLPPSLKDPNITFSMFKKLLKTELFQHWT